VGYVLAVPKTNKPSLLHHPSRLVALGTLLDLGRLALVDCILVLVVSLSLSHFFSLLFIIQFMFPLIGDTLPRYRNLRDMLVRKLEADSDKGRTPVSYCVPPLDCVCTSICPIALKYKSS
jgi:hypothetical protein